MADVDAKRSAKKPCVHERAVGWIALRTGVDDEWAAVDGDFFGNGGSVNGENVGKVWGVDRWAEADIAEADTPLWVDNVEGAYLEVTEMQ